MSIYNDLAAILFSVALLINAFLFVPQAIRILKEQTAKGVSLVTFLGFWLTQSAIVIHGFIKQDYLLTAGYLLSMVTCGVVIFLIIHFRRKQGGYIKGEEISLDEIIKQLPAHIYWKNKDGVFLGCNTENWQDFGLKSLGDYIGKTDYDIFPKEQAEEIIYNDREVMRTRQCNIVEEDSDLGDGTTALFLSHKIPLKNKRGNIIGIAGVSLDITTARKKEIERLDFLEKIIALMPGHVYWIDREGVYRGCNDEQAKSAGLKDRKEIVGKRNKDLPWNYNFGKFPEEADKNNQEVMKSGKTIVVEEPAELQNGTKAIFLSSKVPMKNKNGDVVGMVGISIDITKIKNFEKELKKAKNNAEKANRLKSDFISNMEHDIRTPLIGIYGMMEILANKEIDPEKKNDLNDISVCAKELMDFCNGILDFSKIETESFPIVSKSFALQKLVDSVTTIEMIAARNKKLNLSAVFDKQLPKIVISDPYRLKRILINLVSNAIKFTKEGAVKISVNLDKKDTQNRKIVVKFVVTDTGMGIPDDKKVLIYERFTKVTPSNRGLYKGLGLGLRIVKQFVDELNGDIHLKSEVGKGSAFTIFLPFKIPLSDEIIDEE